MNNHKKMFTSLLVAAVVVCLVSCSLANENANGRHNKMLGLIPDCIGQGQFMIGVVSGVVMGFSARDRGLQFKESVKPCHNHIVLTMVSIVPYLPLVVSALDAPSGRWEHV